LHVNRSRLGKCYNLAGREILSFSGKGSMKIFNKFLSVMLLACVILGLLGAPALDIHRVVQAEGEAPTATFETTLTAPEATQTAVEPTLTPEAPTAQPTEQATFTPTQTPGEPPVTPTQAITPLPSETPIPVLPTSTLEPTQTSTEVPIQAFKWDLEIDLAPDQAVSLRSDNILSQGLAEGGVSVNISGNKMALSGNKNLEQVQNALFDSLKSKADFLGGPAEIVLHLPANPDQVISLSLESRLTAGYSWEAIPTGGNSFTRVSTPEFTPHSQSLGSAEIEKFNVKSNGSGDGTIKLVYRRPFETDKPTHASLNIWMPDFQQKIDLSNPNPTILQDDSATSSQGEENNSNAEITAASLPSAFDWRTKGVVPGVRDQGPCGSCWAFGTVGIMESAVKIATGVMTDLSEQFLVSCNRDGWGCVAGGYTKANKYHKDTLGMDQSQIGAVLESDMPYTASDSPCSIIVNHPYRLSDWQFVTGSEFTMPTISQIKNAIYTYGPVEAGVYVGSAFQGYSGGIFSTNETDSTFPTWTNHRIILVGWDDSGQYWILRNSWGSGWGEGGYMRIKYNTSLVGQGTTWAIYPKALLVTAAPSLVSPKASSLINDNVPALTWGSVPNANAYQVQISGLSTFTSPVQDVTGGVGVLTYTATPLAEGKWYWRVRGLNIAGTPGPWSNNLSFMVDTTPPLKPVLSAPANGSSPVGTPTFSWKASNTATHYQFEYNTANNPGAFIYQSRELTSTTNKPPIMAATNPPTVFYWFVRAEDAAGNWSGWSAPFTVTIQPPTPAAPALDTPATGLITNNPAPELKWKSVPYGATFELQIDDSSSFSPLLLTKDYLAISDLSYIIDALPEGKFYWRARAHNVNGVLGAWSSSRSFTVDITPPLKPALSAPGNGSSPVGTPTFSWKASVSATHYQFEYNNANNSDAFIYRSGELTATTHKPPTILATNPPTTMYWFVRAEDAAGNWSGWSNPFTVTIRPPVPAAPALSAPASGYQTIATSLDLSWHAVTYGNTYQIQIDDSSGFTSPNYTYTSAVGALSDTVGPLLPGKWYWRVRSFNVNNVSGAWSSSRNFRINLASTLGSP
jgi:C1A family cysteine protease